MRLFRVAVSPPEEAVMEGRTTESVWWGYSLPCWVVSSVVDLLGNSLAGPLNIAGHQVTVEVGRIR